MCVLLGYLQKTRAIPIMNPLSWFMIIVLGDISRVCIRQAIQIACRQLSNPYCRADTFLCCMCTFVKG